MTRRYSLFGFGPSDFAGLFNDVFASDAWRDFDRLFSSLGSVQAFPPYNIYALKDGSVKVEIALAGYAEDEISLTAEDGKLVVEGKKKICECDEEDKKEEGKECCTEEKNDECKCVYHGIRASNFKTVIPVASRFDLSKTKAHMRNGMLIINVPLAEERLARKIELNVEK